MTRETGADGASEVAFEEPTGALAWRLALGAALTLLSFGFYRFWLRTQLRRILFSHLSIGGDRVEYAGRALEMLIGFLIAVSVLGLYIAAVAIILNFAAISIYDADAQAPTLVALAVGLPLVPLWPYAIYRAYGYYLSRLSWRGVRFGVVKGAWGYAGVAILWGLAQILSLGLLTPLAEFRLRQYLTRRMRFGDVPFALEGGLRDLAGAWAVVYGFIALIVASFAAAYALGGERAFDENPWLLAPIFVGAIGAPIAYFYYRNYRFRVFLLNTSIGEARFTAAPPAWRLTLYDLGAYLMANLVISAGVFAGIIALALVFLGLSDLAPQSWWTPEGFDPPNAAKIAAVAVFALIVVGSGAAFAYGHDAIYLSFALGAIASDATISGLDALAKARQRAASEEDGEGFADALDIGAI